MGTACDKTLKVGIGQPWPPFVMIHGNDFSGIDIEITRQVFTEAGFCAEFIALPSSIRGLAELEKGTVDVLPAASFSKQRAQYSHFSLAYRHERMRLFWHEDNELSELDLASLMANNKTFVINSGGYYGQEFEQLTRQPSYNNLIVKVKMIEQRIYMLQAKRVDFMIDDELSGLYVIAQKQMTGIKLHPYVVHDNPIHFMYSKKTVTTAQSQKIDDAIVKLSGQIENIIAEYTTAI
ncbi:transporter substrate-binding domain-containing protein [Pseudoalteromonas shioyasakiensis]|uniref:substrate-binding periplasmic protein n=1 Tax=Pseudoalteromonas shioyasakiensis TaxID=1190813 RepID=UPI00211858A4|nr:transporter substrate-binding domain-containing protein [Pseudoalteromonas shioyasakiensis]MCQ8878811.1 transporter substrate-binding domain-containing protein [Pseudoalteromonas shioyasakiensis]